MLLLRANRWVTDDELRDVVWPSGAPPSARGNLKSYVSQLRQWFGTTETAVAEVARLTDLRWSAREMLGAALLAAGRAGDAATLLRVMSPRTRCGNAPGSTSWRR